MSGTIFLGGGGSADDEAALWDQLFVPGQRVVVWPFALSGPQQEAAARWAAGELSRRGDFALETWLTDDGHAIAELHAADVLLITGGNTFDLLAYLRGRGWLPAIGEFVAGGGLLYGGSAGAILCGASIATAAPMDPNDAGIEDLTALDLLAGCVVRPHHEPRDNAAAQQWARDHGRTVIAISERAGVIVDGSTAHNAGPAVVHTFTADGQHLVHEAGDTWQLAGRPAAGTR